MKVEVLVPTTIELKPGDKVKFKNVRYRSYVLKEVVTTIDKLVETKNRTYATFRRGYTWRPLSTYGKTWFKVEDE